MNTQSKILKGSLIVGIVIVINLFFNYSLSLIYKNPSYEAFCPTKTQVVPVITTQEQCVANGGQWNENNYEPVPVNRGDVVSKGYCNENFTCGNAYQDAQRVYDRNVFITLVLLGALLVTLGSYLKNNSLIANALSMSGVLSFIIASMRYWSSADDLIKVIILAIALAILIWVAVKKFKDKQTGM